MNSKPRRWTARQLLVLVLLTMSVTWWLSPWRAEATTTTCTPAVRGVPFKSSDYTYRHSDVWLYGDSITYQTWRDLKVSVPSLATDAWWGRSTASAVTALSKDVHRFPQRLPAQVVMAVGTNDLLNLDEFARQVRLARAVLPARVRIVWVNVYTETSTRWNLADRILMDQPGISVAHWSTANLNHLGSDGKSIYLLDGIHVNGSGCVARNALIRRALS